MTRDHLKSDEVIKTIYLNPGIGHRSPIIPSVYSTVYTECTMCQSMHSTVRWSDQKHGSGSRQTESLEFCAEAFVDEKLVVGFLGRCGRMFCLVIKSV